MQAAAAATQQYQLTLPFALPSVAPGLAALHASRARLLHPSDASLGDTHCPRCGAPIVYGLGEIRSLRSNKRKTAVTADEAAPSPRRFLRRVCGVCGHHDDIPLQTSSPSSFPPVRRRKRAEVNAQATSLSAVVDDAQMPQRVSRAGSPQTTHSAPDNAPHPLHTLPLPPTSSSSPHSRMLREPVSTAPSSASAPSKSKPRSKKPGLQALLARNREKQEQEKRREQQGLSTFLQTLQ